jgi:hypothetical protein
MKTDFRQLHYNVAVPDSPQLVKVLDHLRLYDHPLLTFSARETSGRIDVLIDLKNSTVPVHQYVLPIHPRDLDHPQFAWHLQRQIYDGLHDYFVEMFTSTPQDSVVPRSTAADRSVQHDSAQPHSAQHGEES